MLICENTGFAGFAKEILHIKAPLHGAGLRHIGREDAGSGERQSNK